MSIVRGGSTTPMGNSPEPPTPGENTNGLDSRMTTEKRVADQRGLSNHSRLSLRVGIQEVGQVRHEKPAATGWHKSTERLAPMEGLEAKPLARPS